VTNTAQVASVTLNFLTDDKYGDITTVHAAGGGFNAVTATNCTPLPTIAAGQTFSCMFTGTVPPGDTGGRFTDVVSVGGTDSFGNSCPTSLALCDNDDAFVTYRDVPQAPTLSKTAMAAACLIDVTYAVVVTWS
jgi:hypothetical protein